MTPALYVRTLGSGPELVLLHGWGLHGDIWGELPERLAPHFRLTIVDLPGHGRSAACALGDSIAELATAVAAVVPARAAWLGWSLGGLAAQWAARHLPGRVSALALAGATPRFVQAADWPAGLAPEILAGFARALGADYAATLTRFLTLQAGGEGRAVVKALRARLFAHGEPTAHALAQGLRLLERTDLRADIAGLSMPVLLLHGTRDQLAPVAAARWIAERLPQAQLHLFAGAGHAPFLSHATEFAGIVTEALA